LNLPPKANGLGDQEVEIASTGAVICDRHLQAMLAMHGGVLPIG
jgi:hypothetical protein